MRTLAESQLSPSNLSVNRAGQDGTCLNFWGLSLVPYQLYCCEVMCSRFLLWFMCTRLHTTCCCRENSNTAAWVELVYHFRPTVRSFCLCFTAEEQSEPLMCFILLSGHCWLASLVLWCVGGGYRSTEQHILSCWWLTSWAWCWLQARLWETTQYARTHTHTLT